MINNILKRAVIGQPEPTIGMGCTMLSYSDRNPGTIQEVFQVGTRTLVRVSDDDIKLIKTTGKQEYVPNKDANYRHFRRSKDGIWVCVRFDDVTNRWVKAGTLGLRIGERDHYYDPHF